MEIMENTISPGNNKNCGKNRIFTKNKSVFLLKLLQNGGAEPNSTESCEITEESLKMTKNTKNQIRTPKFTKIALKLLKN